jgi:catalase
MMYTRDNMEDGFIRLTLTNSDNIYGVWHNADARQIIVQYKKAFKRYRFSNITQDMVDHMKSLQQDLGSYIRKTISMNPAAYPVETLD